VFRHGERTPSDTYPEDPYFNFTFEPVGWGQLTNVGKLSQYQQGQYLRTRYGEFLGNIYTPGIIKVQTTDVDRTKCQHSWSLLDCGPAPEQRWNPSLEWQPIPYTFQPRSEDSLLLPASCPKYYHERDAVKASVEVQNILVAHNATELYNLLAEKTGLNYTDPDDVQSLYSTLKAEEDYNLTLPEWTHGIYPDRLIPLTVFSFVLNTYNDELQKLKGGLLLKKILSDTKAKVDSTLSPADRKMYMYAGHDSTVTNLLSALKVWDPQIPKYGIMAMVELHFDKDENQHSVKVFLRNSTHHEPYLLTVPGCNSTCPLDMLITLTTSVTPQNWKKNCVVDDPNYLPPGEAPP
ncbi:hypothetical protein ANN_08142, partial [Periplaneta americana]